MRRLAVLALLPIASQAAAQAQSEITDAEQLNAWASELYEQGKYDEAIPFAERSLRILERALGGEHPHVAASLYDLAALYEAWGDSRRAEPLYRRSLRIREKALGPDHPDVAQSLNNLATLYRERGHYLRAEPLYQRALQIREKARGQNHPDVATSLDGLATLYQKMGDSLRAEPLYQRALCILEKALGPDHADVATSLNNLATLYRERGDYLRAEPLYQRALRILEKALGPDHPRVAAGLSNLATLYKKKGDYLRAEPLYQQALRIREKALGINHPEVAASLNNLGALYADRGDYARAEPLYQRALRIQEKTLGPDHPDVAASLNNLGALYQEKGDSLRARPLCERALRIQEKTLGPDHPDVAASLDSLALLYMAKGDYAQAETLYGRSLRIREKALGPDHPEVAASLNNLGALYADRGDYARAEPLHLRSLRIWEDALGPDHPRVAASLDSLALLYMAKGDYAEAETLCGRSLRIREKALGPDHPDVAASLNNLGMLYREKGDYARAEPLYLRSLGILEKVLGPDHPSVAKSLNGLVDLYLAKGYDLKVEPLYERSLRIWEKALGPDHPYVAASLNSLALLYMAKGDYAQAETLYGRSLRIREKALGPDHPDVAASLNNLGVLYREKGDYARAEPLYLRSLGILEKTLGPDHPSVAKSLNGLAEIYQARREWRRAVDAKKRAEEASEHNLAAVLATGAEEQKRTYFAMLSGGTDSTVSLHVRSAPVLPEAAHLSLTTILRRKGRVLEAMRDLLRVLRQIADPGDLAHIDELAGVRAELATRTLRRPGPSEDPQAEERRLAGLREKGQQIEETLAARYAALGLKQAPVTLEAVQAALPPDAALVEYFVFKPFDPRAKPASRWGKPRYVAYVLRPQGEPGWADLGEAEPIDQLAREVRAKYAAGDRAATDPARALDELIMEPVRKLLGNTTEVFLSPDGELNLVPFGALPDEKGKYLVKRYRLTYLSSGRDLLRLDLRADAQEPPAIMAAPDYGDPGEKPSATGSEHGLRSADMASIMFRPLPGTLAEAKRLARTLPDSRLLTGADATEGALKAMRGPRLLHLATHGFFLSDLPVPDPNLSERGISHIEPVGRPSGPGIAPSVPQFAPSTRKMGRVGNPLLRSGLALAGANRRESGKDDGILTALEAMALDLIGTQLVVLSACETGMGDARTGEGVYGLRRALVLAGAETQIMSLWKIDDETTANLMAEYYERIGKGEGRSDAMRAVTLKLLANPKTANPKYWASFIVSGDPRPLGRQAPTPLTGKRGTGPTGR